MKNISGTSRLVAAALTAGLTTMAMGQDECASAVTAVVGANAFNTATATTSAEPVDANQCPGTYLDWGTANKDIWFTFTAPSNGLLDFDTCFAAGFDTSIVVYTGTCAALTQISCNGDGAGLTGCQGFYSRAPQITATAGTTYFVRIGGWTNASGVSESGAGQLNVAFTAVAGGCEGSTDNCGLVHAAPGCSDPVCCSSVCALSPSCCTDTWDQVCVDAAIAACGIFVYNCTAPNAAVANDCATAATVLTADTFRDINITNCNTDGPNHDGAGCNSGNNAFLYDVWYKYQAVANGIMRVQTCGVNGGPVTSFDSKLAFYDLGTNPAAFDYNTLPAALVACNDDGDTTCINSGGVFPSDLSTSVVVGRTYLIRVASYDLPGTARVTFDFPEPCALPAETGVEGEACGSAANNGCFAGGAVQEIALGNKIKGSFNITADAAGALTRDVDFYSFTLGSDKQITATVHSASFVDLFIMQGDIVAANCAGINIISTGSGACPSTASICLKAGTYYVFVGMQFAAGATACGGALSEYVLSLDGVDASCPALLDTICQNPGPDTTSTSIPQASTGNFVQGCATGCGNGTGGSADMMFAASFSGANLPKELNCVNFGVAALRSLQPAGATACGYYDTDLNLPGRVVVYRDTNGGAPTNPISSGIAGADLEEIAAADVLVPSGVYMANFDFDPPLCLENETTVVVVFETYNLFNGTNPANVPAGAGYRSGIGVAVPAAGQTFPESNVWGRYTLCTGAAQNVFAPFGVGTAGITYQWPIQMNGTIASCSTANNCPTDLNGDGVTGSADLTIVLNGWGGTTPDLNGDGVVGSADLTVILNGWGACP